MELDLSQPTMGWWRSGLGIWRTIRGDQIEKSAQRSGGSVANVVTEWLRQSGYEVATRTRRAGARRDTRNALRPQAPIQRQTHTITALSGHPFT